MVSRCFPYVSHVFPSPNSLKFAVMLAVTQPAGQPSVRCKPFQPQHVASWVFLKWPWSSKICQAGKFATEKVLREGCGDGDVVWIGQFIEHMYKNDWGCKILFRELCVCVCLCRSVLFVSFVGGIDRPISGVPEFGPDLQYNRYIIIIVI